MTKCLDAEHGCKARICINTNNCDKALAAKSRALGVDFHFQKPVDQEKILPVMRYRA